MVTDQTILSAAVFVLYSLGIAALAGSVSMLVDAWVTAWRE